MQTYIALFRGINVGGKNSLPMKELVSVLEALGAQNVRTYIQSGNAVLQHKDKDPSRLGGKIAAEIRRRRGFEPTILLLGSRDLEQAMTGNPFPEAEAEPKTLHVGFLAARPVNADLPALEGLKKASERFLLRKTFFYLHAPEGVGRSKLAASAEKLLGVPMTDRNWRTVCKLGEMVKALN